jgi:hypothetical protein
MCLRVQQCTNMYKLYRDKRFKNIVWKLLCVQSAMTVVEFGDVIEFSKKAHPEVIVKWQQNFVKYSESYLRIPFCVVDNRDKTGVLFVQV